MDIVRFSETQHLAGLRECVIELQDHERSIESRMPPGAEIADDYIEKIRERCVTSDGQIFIATVAGEVAGYATVLARVTSDEIEDGDAEYGLISDLVVKAGYRRRGLGRRLLGVAEEYARNADVAWLRIGVLAGNKAAYDLYGTEGFSALYVELEKRLADG